MSPRLVEIYRSVRPKEALKSQDIYESANVLLGSEVEKFAALIVKECIWAFGETRTEPNLEKYILDRLGIKEHFGVEE